MTYTLVTGLRIFAIEIGVLVATFVLVWLAIRLSVVRAGQFPALQWLLARNWRAVVFVVVVSLLGRGLLLPVIGVPAPRINDEYSYLLMADTFAHHRLSNPTPADWRHFETFHVNMTPTYHSKYPFAHGLFLAFGQIVFGQPWIGVLLSTALLCGAICWALQAFFSPGWALLGGLLAVVRISLFSFWANSYFGPQVAALGGAVALGGVVRVFEPDTSRRQRTVASLCFAIGLLILATSRPYEGLAFSVPLLVYFGYQVLKQRRDREVLLASVLPIVLVGVLGAVAIGTYDRATTGNALLQPYPLNARTYWPLPLFVGQKEARNIEPSDPVFAQYFEQIKNEYEPEKAASLSGVFSLEVRRFWEDWFFYVGPALTLPVLIGLVSSAKEPRLRIVVLATLCTTLALALYLYSMSHYAAPLMVAVFVYTVEGLRYLWDTKQNGERAFAIAIVITVVLVSLARQSGITTMNTAYSFPDERKAITDQLLTQPGKHLVLVTYDMERHYPGNELVHNGADFASEKILWARSKGIERDAELCSAYSDRRFWSVAADDQHYKLAALELCR